MSGYRQDEVQHLFLSVGWVSGQYPARLYKALMNSSTVITAWDKKHLVGLVRIIDDSELVAYMHYVLVDPAYHGRGIASTMILMVKEKYKNYLYMENITTQRTRGTGKNPFYLSLWFLQYTQKKQWTLHSQSPLVLEQVLHYLSNICIHADRPLFDLLRAKRLPLIDTSVGSA